MDRRSFLTRTLAAAPWLWSGVGCSSSPEPASAEEPEPVFRISLAEWSLHRELQAGELDPLDFAGVARELGLDAVEYVNVFFFDRAKDEAYLGAMKARADDAGVRSLLIMCDREGDLGDPEPERRDEVVENHRKWLEAAASLGCHSVRVNARSDPSLGFREQQGLAADGLRRLCELADPLGVNVLVENHGGLSSNGTWLGGVMDRVDHPRVGTLPDFGNFLVRAEPEEWYDRYRGVEELMPYARAVSAKSYEFDESGNETRTDFRRMMRIVLGSGYRGYVGIEYEGDGLGEREGIAATRSLLLAVRDELTPEFSQGLA